MRCTRHGCCSPNRAEPGSPITADRPKAHSEQGEAPPGAPKALWCQPGGLFSRNHCLGVEMGRLLGLGEPETAESQRTWRYSMEKHCFRSLRRYAGRVHGLSCHCGRPCSVTVPRDFGHKSSTLGSTAIELGHSYRISTTKPESRGVCANFDVL